jgi:hypothetical protein
MNTRLRSTALAGWMISGAGERWARAADAASGNVMVVSIYEGWRPGPCPACSASASSASLIGEYESRTMKI